MTVLSSELIFNTSVNSGSTGGINSGGVIVSGNLNNIFDDVSAEESDSGHVDYRKIFVKNTNLVDNLINAKIWLSSETSSPDDQVLIGIGSSSDDDGSNELVDLGESTKIYVYSTDGDTRTLTLTGEDVLGNRISESISLTGIVGVSSFYTYKKLYLASVSYINSFYTIVIKKSSDGSQIGTIPVKKYSAILYQNVTTQSSAIILGTINANSDQAIWLKRMVDEGASGYNLNQGTIEVLGETA